MAIGCTARPRSAPYDRAARRTTRVDDAVLIAPLKPRCPPASSDRRSLIDAPVDRPHRSSCVLTAGPIQLGSMGTRGTGDRARAERMVHRSANASVKRLAFAARPGEDLR